MALEIMKPRKMHRFLILLMVSIMTFLIWGCAASITANMLNSRMGLMNYEEAIQRFGPPTNCAEAGNTKTCTWIYGSGGTVFVPVGQNVLAVPTDAPSASLWFTNDKLTYWKLNGNWE